MASLSDSALALDCSKLKKSYQTEQMEKLDQGSCYAHCIIEHAACQLLNFHYLHSTRFRNNMARYCAVFGGGNEFPGPLLQAPFPFLRVWRPAKTNSRFVKFISENRSCKRRNIIKIIVSSLQRKSFSRFVVIKLIHLTFGSLTFLKSKPNISLPKKQQ